MNNFWLIKLLLNVAYKFSRLCGIITFHYSDEQEKFVTYWYDLIYPIFAFLSFAYFYPTSGLSVIAVLNPLVVVAFFYMTVTTISIIFVMQCLRAKDICVLLNDIAILNNELIERHRNLPTSSSWPYILLGLAKIVVVNMMAQTAVIYCCTTLGIMLTGHANYFVVFLISWAYFWQTIVPNMFYVGVLGASFHFEQINGEISGVIREASRLAQGQRDFTLPDIKEKFDALTQRLDILAVLHTRLVELVTRANRICSLQLLFSTANFVGILLIEVSSIYFVYEGELQLLSSTVFLRVSVCGGIISNGATNQCWSDVIYINVLRIYFLGVVYVDHGLFESDLKRK